MPVTLSLIEVFLLQGLSKAELGQIGITLHSACTLLRGFLSLVIDDTET